MYLSPWLNKTFFDGNNLRENNGLLIILYSKVESLMLKINGFTDLVYL